jgi:hypothetical protein
MQSLTFGRSLVDCIINRYRLGSFQKEVWGSVAASKGIDESPFESIYSARAMHVGCTSGVRLSQIGLYLRPAVVT